MNPIGDMDPSSGGACLELGLTSPIEILELSKTDNRGVDAMRLTKDERSKTFGDLSEEIYELVFEEEYPLIGLYGYQSDNKIQ